MTPRSSHRNALIAALAFLVFISSTALAQDFSSDDCAACHTDTGGDPAEVTIGHLDGSVHEGLECMDCHTGISDLPHDELPPADCSGCHGDVVEAYTQHGRGFVGESEFIPSCSDCHGSHHILDAQDRNSPINPANIPETCGKCHEDQDLIAELKIRFQHPIRVYDSSVHGKASAGGLTQAATCNDCHSTDGSAHHIYPPIHPESRINHFNIPKTCGQCHRAIEEEYWEGIHGQLTARGEVDAPICTTCHGEHGILSIEDPRSPVSTYRLAEATCTPCHESAALNEKYNLPTGRMQSFVDSYHGLKSMAGDKSVANCASCHEAHLILPAYDERSSVNPANLQQTCGHCHEGISAEVATVPIHETATGHRAGLAHLIQIIYVGLIIVVIGGMVVHWLIDLYRRIRDVIRQKPQVRRMEPNEVAQHTLLAVSFIALVVTGFSLRFYDAWWSTMLFGHEGGAGIRGIIHRISGVLLILGSIWHLIFMFTPRGREFFLDMLPKWSDAKQFFQRMRFNLGQTEDPPKFGRFSYVEKAEYWALIWGTVVMGITGLMLWFDNTVAHYLPKGAMDVVLVIHYYEAWLAALAILIWHMYATVFNPEVYPMNPSWITGKMPLHMYQEEHAAVEVKKEHIISHVYEPGTTTKDDPSYHIPDGKD